MPAVGSGPQGVAVLGHGSHGWLSPGHRRLARSGEPEVLLSAGIGGWLRVDDALALYELAFHASGDVLELGSYQGLSASVMAGALAEQGRPGRTVLSIDIQPHATATSRANLEAAGLGEWAQFRCEDAAAACDQLSRAGRRFDLVFVDHSHAYSDVAAACCHLPQLVAPGGACVFHDFTDGRNADPDDAEYDVVRAVAGGLDSAVFAFEGVRGCSAVFRRR